MRVETVRFMESVRLPGGLEAHNVDTSKRNPIGHRTYKMTADYQRRVVEIIIHNHNERVEVPFENIRYLRFPIEPVVVAPVPAPAPKRRPRSPRLRK